MLELTNREKFRVESYTHPISDHLPANYRLDQQTLWDADVGEWSTHGAGELQEQVIGRLLNQIHTC